jgi:hypothetical protein
MNKIINISANDIINKNVDYFIEIYDIYRLLSRRQDYFDLIIL